MHDDVNPLDEAVVWLGALIAPYGVWFVEQVWASPAVIEELVKVWLVSRLVRVGGGMGKAFVVGGLFGASETVFYLINAFQYGSLSPWWQRWLWTVPMHALTAGVLWFGFRMGGWWRVVGFVAAVAIHAGFNSAVMGRL
jgi:hypothetical protein